MKDPAHRPRPHERIPTALSRESRRFPGLAFPLRHSHRRLPDVDYASPDCLCFVTWCEERCRWRRVWSSPPELANAWTMDQRLLILDALVATVNEARAQLDVACVMLDHVHAVLAPGGQGLTIQQIVGRAKGRASAAERRGGRASLRWQEGCWDRVLRPDERAEESLGTIYRYVLENPVEAGLVARWQDYPATYRAP